MQQPPSVYTAQKITPSEKIQTNPKYERLFREERENDPQSIFALFGQWTEAFHRIEKCRVEMQRHKSAQREIEGALKTALQSFLASSKSKSFVVPFRDPKSRKRERANDDDGDEDKPPERRVQAAFLSVEDEVRKKAFSAKLLRGLLVKQLGAEQGEEVFRQLESERAALGQTVSQLKVRKKTRAVSLT